jgi:hypothetical protein
VADADGEGFARRLMLACSHARRAAIATGDNHLIRFTLAGGQASQYALYRRQGASTNRIDAIQTVPDNVTVTTNATDLEFNFTGEALSSYSVAVQSPDRSWTIAVPQVTGKALLQ